MVFFVWRNMNLLIFYHGFCWLMSWSVFESLLDLLQICQVLIDMWLSLFADWMAPIQWGSICGYDQGSVIGKNTHAFMYVPCQPVISVHLRTGCVNTVSLVCAGSEISSHQCLSKQLHRSLGSYLTALQSWVMQCSSWKFVFVCTSFVYWPA